MSSKKSLVTTKDKNFKEGIIDMRTKSNVIKEDILPTIAKNNIDKVNKTSKPQSYKRNIYKSISNKSDKSK